MIESSKHHLASDKRPWTRATWGRRRLRPIAGPLSRNAVPRLVSLGFILSLVATIAQVVSPSSRTFGDSEYLIDSWETDQGLPENSATAIVQTPDGHLWFGSFNGLVRFDGVKFKVFDPSNTPGLPGVGIVNIHLDASRRLWASTDRGLVVSTPDRWTDFQPVATWTGSYVRTFSENGGVLCATSFEGKVLRAQGNEFAMLPDPPGQPGSGYLGHVDRDGRIWVSQHQSAYVGFWDGRDWQRSDLAAQMHPGFVSMTGLPDGRLLVLKTNAMLYIEGGRVQHRVLLQWSPPVVNAWSVSRDHQSNIWVSAHGLYRVSPSGETRYFSTTNGLTYDSLRCTFADREHNLWVGSSGGGLMRFKPRAFVSYGEESGLTERNVKAVIEESPGRMLIGTFGSGIFRWEAGRAVRLPEEQQVENAYVQNLLLDRERNLWIACHSGDPGTTNLTILKSPHRRDVTDTEDGVRNVRALFQDSIGRIWIGGGTTVSIYAEGQFKRLEATPGMRLDDVRCFAEDPRQGDIYAGGAEGLFRFTAGEWHELRRAADIPVRGATCLRFERDGTLWIGGMDAGLLRFKDGRWAAVTEQQGLPHCRIGCILADDRGYWWLGSNRGVVRVAHADLVQAAEERNFRLACHVFNLSDGLASVECTIGGQTTGAKDSQGRLWFTTLKGITMVDPRKFPLNPLPPPILPESLVYLDRKRQPVTLILGQSSLASPAGGAGAPPQIVLPPGSRQLEVRFAVLSFTAPEKVRLRFELIHNNERYLSQEGSERSVTAPWLPAGQYEIRASAANNDGVWNETGCSLALVVQPFWWQTAWCKGLAGLALMAGIVGVVGKLHRRRLHRTQEQLQQQQALANERARSAALTQHSSDIITLLNAEGRIIYESPSATRILGYPEGHLVGKNPIEFVHPDDQDTAKAALQRVVAQTNLGIPTAMRFRHAQGHWIYLESLGRNLLDQPGVQGILVTSRDITERQRAEEELRRSERHWRTTFDAIGDSVALVSADGEILRCNAAMEKLAGKPAAEIVGHRCCQIIHHVAEPITDCPLVRARQTLRRETMDLPVGSRVFQVTVDPLLDADGRLTSVVHIMSDITERKIADHRIRQQAALLEATNDAILVWDTKHGVQYMNHAAEELTGCKLAEAQSKDLGFVLHPRSDLVLRAALQEVTTNGSWTGELVLFTELQPRTVASRWTILTDTKGKPTSVLITCNDITEKKHLQDQYLHAQRLESVGTLASGVAHDLNNILSPIIMGVEMLAMNPVDEETRSLLTTIRDSAHRGRDTIKQLLTFARGTESQKGPVQPRHLLKEIARLLQQTFPKNIQIYTDYAGQPATLLADPSQVHQVLMNLCVNARDAMPDGGVLFLTLENQTLDTSMAKIHPKAQPIPYVVFKVSDSGAGIPPEVADRIFDPFFTTKPQGKGTGLGLATALGIVEEHGGFITVDSQEGRGATFQVYLPATTGQDTEPVRTETGPVPPGHGELVLVVDDEEAILRMAEGVLRRGGYTTLTANSASEAMHLYEKHHDRIQVILTDIMMPFGDGRQLIAMLFEQDSHLPIVAMSGLATREFQQETLRRGARAFVAKPFNAEQLLATLAEVLRPPAS